MLVNFDYRRSLGIGIWINSFFGSCFLLSYTHKIRSKIKSSLSRYSIKNRNYIQSLQSIESILTLLLQYPHWSKIFQHATKLTFYSVLFRCCPFNDIDKWYTRLKNHVPYTKSKLSHSNDWHRERSCLLFRGSSRLQNIF